MAASRRDFIKLAGFSVAGLCFGGPTGCATTAPVNGQGTAGKRWALVVDLRTPCPEGCTACMKSCNLAHNIPQWDDIKHEIKWIWKEPWEHVFPEQVHSYSTAALRELPVPVLCNHCDNPPCVRACPTKATFKTASGIVAMDQHRCIGCRYCLAACPYGARSFNWLDPRERLEEQGAALSRDFPTRTKGVVEKCNFCSERINDDASALPYCVEACREACSRHGREPVLHFGDLHDPSSPLLALLRESGANTIRRKPEIGTRPHVFYLV